MKIHDPNGIVYKNTSRYPFTDPTTGIRFESGESAKVTPTDWIKSQPVLVEQLDTTDEDAAAAQAAADAAADAAAELAKQQQAEADKVEADKKAAELAAANAKKADEAPAKK